MTWLILPAIPFAAIFLAIGWWAGHRWYPGCDWERGYEEGWADGRRQASRDADSRRQGMPGHPVQHADQPARGRPTGDAEDDQAGYELAGGREPDWGDQLSAARIAIALNDATEVIERTGPSRPGRMDPDDEGAWRLRLAQWAAEVERERAEARR